MFHFSAIVTVFLSTIQLGRSDVMWDGLTCLLDPAACFIREAVWSDPAMIDWSTCSKVLDDINVSDVHLPIMDVLQLPKAISGHQAAVAKAKLWPDNEVPLRLQPRMATDEQKRIACAMMFFHEKTCVRFVQQKPQHLDFVTIKKSHNNGLAEGCYSDALGVKRGEQIVLLDERLPPCWKHGTMVHELMHAIGFFHEQARNDRDKYIEVHWDEIPSLWEPQFMTASKLHLDQQLIGEYDYKSVMHYPRFLPMKTTPTMTALKQPIDDNNKAMGQRVAPTALDAIKINVAYGCHKPDKDCQVSAWQEWSPCTKTCGGGMRTRARTIVKQPTGNGKACPTLTENGQCNTEVCPTNNKDCKMSNWSSWGGCSKVCGSGTKTRTRSVTTEPSGNGKPCPTLTQQQSTCNTHICQQNCQVTQWDPWGPCTKTCGGGQRSRRRRVHVWPTANGNKCPSLQENSNCNTAACPAQPTDHRRWVLIQSRMSWSSARNHCKSRGGDLVSIRNHQQHQHAISLDAGNRRRKAHWTDGYNWIGGHISNGWKWADGSAVPSWGWAPTQPASEEGGTQCMTINTKGWFDYICSGQSPLRFICTV